MVMIVEMAINGGGMVMMVEMASMVEVMDTVGMGDATDHRKIS